MTDYRYRAIWHALYLARVISVVCEQPFDISSTTRFNQQQSQFCMLRMARLNSLLTFLVTALLACTHCTGCGVQYSTDQTNLPLLFGGVNSNCRTGCQARTDRLVRPQTQSTYLFTGCICMRTTMPCLSTEGMCNTPSSWDMLLFSTNNGPTMSAQSTGLRFNAGHCMQCSLISGPQAPKHTSMHAISS